MAVQQANGTGKPQKIIDLRSDTVTKPSQAMLAAVANLSPNDIGDDIYGEDATVNKLQALAAKITGKEAALFVPTGTMGNLASILAHCGRGDEVLLGTDSHVFHYEAGGVSALGGVCMHPLPTLPNGEIPIEALEQAYRDRPLDQHSSRITCVTIENTHNRAGGRVLSMAYMESVQEWAAAKGLPVHLDGARVFNAATALGVKVQAIAALVTTMTFCLSKGLGAPVGSIIAGPSAFIEKAHRLRKQLGGAMRQVAVLAAPGLEALQSSPPLLATDHSNARLIAAELAKIETVEIDEAGVESNIVLWHMKPHGPAAAVVIQRLRDAGIVLGGMKNGIRAVTHLGVSAEDCKYVVSVLRKHLTAASE